MPPGVDRDASTRDAPRVSPRTRSLITPLLLPGAEATASLSIQKAASTATVSPGQTFTYTIQFQCTAGTVNGCVNAALTDPLPDYLRITGGITVSGTAAFDTSGSTGSQLDVVLTDDLGNGQIGLAPGKVVTVAVPVTVDSPLPPEASGEELVNTATVNADNAVEKQGQTTVILDVPETIAAGTSKEIEPAGAFPAPGTPLEVALTGTNESNVPVDQLIISDPVLDADGNPPAPPGEFLTYLGLSEIGEITLPDGAETVQVRVFADGAWQDGPVGPPAALPDDVDPADVTGIQIVFSSTDGEGIAPGAEAGVTLDFAQRALVEGLTEPITLLNEADTTVVTAAGDSATSEPALDDYKIPPSEIVVMAGKTFSPSVVHAGDPSTVTLTGRNDSELPLDSLTITEPASGTPNHFADGAWEFTSMGSPEGSGVIWPEGATSATVTYECGGAAGALQSTDEVDTLPAPPNGCDPVTGFTATFEGEIVPGATATVPFVVTTDPDQDVDELSNANIVGLTGEVDGATGSDAAVDRILTIADRIGVAAGKRLIPSTIPGFPGQTITADLSGELLPFPDSTVDAAEIIVQDPADFGSDEWYDSFDPRAVTATPVPACATMTVQYTPDDGANWIDIDGMSDIAGPTIFNGAIPSDVGVDATGIRFVYSALPAGGSCTGGFPPGTTVSPNLSYALDPAATTEEEVTVDNCAGSSASAPTAPDAASEPACDEVVITPIDPGSIDPVGKQWDVDVLNARSQHEAGATVSWSTAGYSGVGRLDITDSSDPDTTPLPESVFDEFDLVRIDPITPDLDPHLTYDQITRVQLYRLPAGSTDPAAGSWIDAEDDPCPVSCDGVFPGVTLTEDERATTIGFRLTYIESPTRVERIDGPTAPPVGSGVTASTGNDRRLHPVFQLRDELRSDTDVPVTEERLYNTGDEGVVRNTVRATGYWNPEDADPTLTVTDGDDIALVDVPVTAEAEKTWTGGPLGIPEAGVPEDRYPLSRVSLTAHNTTPAKIDALLVSEPSLDDVGPESCTDDPFDAFDLVAFAAITAPDDVGAEDVVITLTPGPGGQATYTREEALALTADDLAAVTGFTVEYTGRVDIDASATVAFDTRLRAADRITGESPAEGQTICDQVRVDAADLVDYPAVEPNTETAYDRADITLVQQGIDVVADKTITPDAITEPSTGPAQVTLSGQPTGPSRAVELVLTDDAATFFNQYDFAGFAPLTWVAPIDAVRVDALVGGSWSLQDGAPVVTGADWVLGDEVASPETALTLPSGVTAEQVQGLRFTFTRVDGANWENPATPTQTVTFSVERRETLHTGGPVLPDLEQNPAAPGETSPGVATNEMTAEVTSSDVDVDGDPLTDSGDATAEIVYHHADNAVQIRKTPSGDVKSPGVPFPYTVTVTNIGEVDIVDPVVTDMFPSDAEGPQIELAPEPEYAYAISGGAGMPTDPADVDATASPAGLVFTFPEGSTLPIGATYTITFSVVTRPGLAAGTEFTNTAGVTANRPWDECDNGADDTADPETGECRTDATNSVLSAGAVRGTKVVRAEGSDELGVEVDPLWVTPVECAPESEGFYARPCLPVAEPGGDVDWRLEFQNSGNLPLDRVLAIDRLPAPGDSLATAPLDRLSEWRPLLQGTRPAVADGDGELAVWFTTATGGWCDGPQAADGALLCPALDWSEWPQGAPLPVDPAAVTGLQFEFLPAAALAPAATFAIDIAMVAPASSPADTPNTDASSGEDTYAFNTVGTSARWINEVSSGYTLTTEPPRVGVALAHGPLRIVKQIAGEGAEQYAPTEFDVTLACVSAGEDIALPEELAELALTGGVPVTIYDLPYHAECTLTEGDNGQTSSTATAAVVQRDLSEIETAVLTNVYEYASLEITKSLDSSAVDQNGDPVPYGPFTIDVTCTFLGEPVYADGFGIDEPMTAELTNDETVAFTGLPAGAACDIIESDDRGAQSTTIATVAGDGDPATTDGTAASIELAAGDGNSAIVTNDFGAGALALVKDVDGDVAELYGTGPFILQVTCVLDDASGERTVWDDAVVLGGDGPLDAEIDDIAAGAACTVVETDAGGATQATIEPEGPVTVGSGETVTVTAVNTFDPASILIDKRVEGDAASFAPGSFPVEVTCIAGGDVLPGFPVTVEVTPGSPTEIDTLAGAECTAIEPASGDATEVTYDPAREDDGEGSDAVVAVGQPEQPATITITNTYRPGGLRVVKLLEGAGALSASGPFAFAVVCAFGDDPTAFSGSVTLRPTGESLTLLSEVIAPLPIGAECTVTETDEGGADGPADPVTVVIPDPLAGAPDGVAIATLVNTFSAGELPSSGGDGRALAIVGGIAVLALLAGGILLVVRRRRQRV